MDSGDKMIFTALAIIVIITMLGTLFYGSYLEGATANPNRIYNASFDTEYSPNNVLGVITAAQNLAATRAPLYDTSPNAGVQLRDGFVGGCVEGMPYQPNGAEFRESYNQQFTKLMTEEDQVYYLGRGMSSLYNKDSPFYKSTNPVKPMMPASNTALRSLHTTENTTPI